MTGEKDEHGWRLLLETQHMKEYVAIVGRIGGATASTAKNYVDKIIIVMKMAEQQFFDEPGMPKDPHEVCNFFLETLNETKVTLNVIMWQLP